MKVLVVDCYDSFTYNLVQQVGALGAEPIVVRSDTPISALKRIAYDRIILSPGPGRPEQAGICIDLLCTLSRTVPTLGVCLGHQAICVAFGGKVVRAPRPMHGKVSRIQHDGAGIFRGIPNPFEATRYHSLIADPASLPPELDVVAESLDDGYVMGVRHRSSPIVGVQFHPESILSPDGNRIIANFLAGGTAA
ncbi:MAG: aminodeoxychorismate/anthranilate synthase component II [Methanobacteriota archaeon]|nr:MAG: aminodeoxychorismate/anthranilate synthase component II [Euryarchaeota archaeon]